MCVINDFWEVLEKDAMFLLMGYLCGSFLFEIETLNYDK